MREREERAISAISSAAAQVGNRRLQDSCRPATRIDQRSIRREPDRAILRTPPSVVKEILEKTPKTSIERASGRDQAIAEWLNWLCESGSLPDRC
jgi:hypothetical protein